MFLRIRFLFLLCAIQKQEWQALGHRAHSHKAKRQTQFWLLQSIHKKTTTTTKTDTCDSRSYKGSWVIDSKRQNYSLIHLSIQSFIPQRYMTLSICHGQDSARYKTQIWKSIKRDKHIKQKIVKQCRNNRFKEVWSGELGYPCPRSSQSTHTGSRTVLGTIPTSFSSLTFLFWLMIPPKNVSKATELLPRSRRLYTYK